MSVMIMKGKLGFNDIRRVIMFNLLLINAASFHMLCLAVICLLYAFFFFFFYVCTHPSPFIHFYSDDLHSFLSSRFPPHMVPPHHSLHTTGIPHPAIVTPTVKQESSQSDVGSLHSS